MILMNRIRAAVDMDKLEASRKAGELDDVTKNEIDDLPLGKLSDSELALARGSVGFN